jgi:hypothetical protein
MSEFFEKNGQIVAMVNWGKGASSYYYALSLRQSRRNVVDIRCNQRPWTQLSTAFPCAITIAICLLGIYAFIYSLIEGQGIVEVVTGLSILVLVAAIPILFCLVTATLAKQTFEEYLVVCLLAWPIEESDDQNPTEMTVNHRKFVPKP